VLIDEYDVPLEKAFFKGYYDKMVGFIRQMFSGALKTNPNLDFAVVTGCLRVSKESIYTGLNNPRVDTLLGSAFGDCFGFTQAEVDGMLSYYGLGARREDMRRWYDGYQVGGADVYNPWSVIQSLFELRFEPDGFLKARWVNTSSNEIVRTLVRGADKRQRGEIEALIAGGTVEKAIRDEVTYGDMLAAGEGLWGFLFFTGYLTLAGERPSGEGILYTLRVPNLEIRHLYTRIVMRWFEEQARGRDRTDLYRAVREGDAEALGRLLTAELAATISYHDASESFYHGFVAALLGGMEGYRAASNRESGDGRFDLTLLPPQVDEPCAVFEFKVAASAQGMAAACEAALGQIRDKRYDAEAREDGYETFLHFGVAFYKKRAMARAARAWRKRIGPSQAFTRCGSPS